MAAPLQHCQALAPHRAGSAALPPRQHCSSSRRAREACRDAAPQLVTSARAPSEDALVDDVLAAVAGSDGSINMAPEQRARVDGMLDQLAAAGAVQQLRPLDNPLLWGNYSVAYTSTRRAPSVRGQPAGGRFRGRIGRALFQTTGVFQSVLQPDIATNKVSFKMFGLLSGAVGLRGKVVPVAAGQPHGQGVAGEGDTVQVLFEPPVLSLGSSLHIRIGPPSSVQLATTYLDERVRLGQGSRGSLFVFTRGGDADAAGMADVGLQRTTPAGLALLCAAFAATALGGWSLWSSGAAALRVLAGGLWLVGLGVLAVLRSGGIIMDDADKRMQQRLQHQVAQQQQQQQQAGSSA